MPRSSSVPAFGTMPRGMTRYGTLALAHHVVGLGGCRADAAVLIEGEQVGHQHDLVLEPGVEAHSGKEELDELFVDAVGEDLLGEVEVDAYPILALLG
eukprot:scaffold37535_cov41-Phaeocystis_antarctica.AAC.1